MARKFTTGLEAGTEWTTTNGAPTIVTTRANSGTHSLRCNPATAVASSISQQIFAADTTAHMFMRAYVYVAAAPAAVTALMAWAETPTTISGFYGVKLLPNRTLIITTSAGTTGGTASTLTVPLNTWTRIEFDYDDTTGTASCYIDGALATSRTGISIGGALYARFGVINPTTADIYFDDIAVNDSTGASDNGLPGPIAVDQFVNLGAARDTNSAGTITRWAPNFSTVSDSFNDGAVNPALWTDSYGDIEEAGGRARVPCRTTYAAYATDTAYKFTGSDIVVQVFPADANTAVVEAWSQVLVISSTAGTDLLMEVDAVAGEINMATRVDYWDENAVRIPYDPVAHSWFRIRESGGSTYWETSPDATAWTVRRTAVTPVWAADTNLGLQLIAHRDAGTENFAEFDNLNWVPTGPELTLAPAADSSTARPLGSGKALPLAAARAVEGARALTVAKAGLLTAAVAEDTARSLHAAHSVRLGAARQADTAGPVTVDRTVRLGTARARDAASAPAIVRTAPIRAAAARETAGALTAFRLARLGTVREQAAATAIGHARTGTVHAGRQADTGLRLALAKTHTLPGAHTGETGRQLVAAKSTTVGVARETARANPVATAGTLRLGAAESSERTTPLAVGKQLVLGAARDTAQGRPLAAGQTVPIGAAREETTGAPVTGVKALRLGTAREHGQAPATAPAKLGILHQAREGAAARALGAGANNRISATRSTSKGRPLAAEKAISLGAARCHDTGHEARPGHTIPLGSARTAEPSRRYHPAKHLTVGAAHTHHGGRLLRERTARAGHRTRPRPRGSSAAAVPDSAPAHRARPGRGGRSRLPGAAAGGHAHPEHVRAVPCTGGGRGPARWHSGGAAAHRLNSRPPAGRIYAPGGG